MTEWKFVSPWRSVRDEASADVSPAVDDTRPRLDHSEADKVVAFLESGSIVMRTTMLIPDPLSESDRPIVPVSVRTDGEWIWNDSLTYFVKTYRLAPPDDFMRYLRGRDFAPRHPSEEEVKAASQALQAA